MTRLIPGQLKWLAGLIILVTTTLLIGGCTPPNQSPVISSLTASEGRVNPSASCQVKCVALDPDGDKLSYSWSASGSISGKGYAITWTAPATAGDYTITVKVSDGRGGEATMQLTIGVTATINHPPAIDSLTAEPQRVKKAKTSTIKCLATDPDGDELTYTWSASGGSISGKGSVATWVAPDTYGTYNITVTVTDSRGGQATKSVAIVVTCCV